MFYKWYYAEVNLTLLSVFNAYNWEILEVIWENRRIVDIQKIKKLGWLIIFLINYRDLKWIRILYIRIVHWETQNSRNV